MGGMERKPNLWLMPWRWSSWMWCVAPVLMLPLLAIAYFTAYLSLARPHASIWSSDGDLFDHVHLEYEFPAQMSLVWRRRCFKFFDPAHQVDRILRPSVWPED